MNVSLACVIAAGAAWTVAAQAPAAPDAGRSDDISVKSFGAKADGATDDTGPFHAALSSVRKGSRLRVPAAVYALKALTIPAGSSIDCDAGAVLRMSNGVSSANEAFLTLESNVIVYGCALDGNYAANPLDRANAAVAWRVPGVAGIEIRDGATGVTLDSLSISDFSGPGVYAYGTGGSIGIRNSHLYGNCNTGTAASVNCGGIYILNEHGKSASQFIISNNIVDNRSTRSGGIKVQATCGSRLSEVQTNSNIVYVGNSAPGDSLGIEYYAAPGEQCSSRKSGLLTRGTINGNILTGSGSPRSFGISLGGGADRTNGAGVTAITVDGNKIHNFVYDAIEVTGASSVVVSNNQITASGPVMLTSNLAAEGVTNLTVTGNNISDSVRSASGPADISVDANMYPITGVTIGHNTIRSSANDAVDLVASNGGALGDVVIDGNVIVGPGMYAIQTTDYAKGVSISGNVIEMAGSALSSNGAITVQGAHDGATALTNNTISTSPVYGIFINGNAPNDRITANTIVAARAGGIFCYACTDGIVTGNVLTGTGSGTGISFTAPVDTVVSTNLIARFATDISPSPAARNCGDGGTVTGMDSGGTISEGPRGMGCAVYFASSHSAPPACTVTSRSGLPFSYFVSKTGIAIQHRGPLNGTMFDYHCGH